MGCFTMCGFYNHFRHTVYGILVIGVSYNLIMLSNVLFVCVQQNCQGLRHRTSSLLFLYHLLSANTKKTGDKNAVIIYTITKFVYLLALSFLYRWSIEAAIGKEEENRQQEDHILCAWLSEKQVLIVIGLFVVKVVLSFKGDNALGHILYLRSGMLQWPWPGLLIRQYSQFFCTGPRPHQLKQERR